MVASTDGTLQVAIPAGALPSNVTVTVTPTTSPGSGSVGTVYEIGPTGTQFATPITLTLAYDPTKLGGTDPSMLRVATYASGSWQTLPGAKVDTTAMTVSGTTTHLSPYTLVTAAGGAVCASVSGGAHCSASSDPGGTGGTATCTPSTCADATSACAGYPGAKMMGCTEGTSGYTATCCFDPGAPICFSSGGGANCASSGGNSTGPSGGTTGTVTCPPPITCATATSANTCSGYPGASVQNCADSSTGYSAACCFDPGAPVCVSVGVAVGCTDSGSTGGGTVSCPPPPSCATSNPCGNTPGTTMSSCTDTTSGYTAVCCYAVGQLPPTGSNSTGGGTPTSGADAGISSGGSGGGTHGGLDAGAVSPPPKDAGGYLPPPPPDGGYVPPPQPDGGYVPPPPKDAGTAPPPQDAGTQPCQLMTTAPSDANSPCGVTEFCPSNGDLWSVRCQSPGTPCSCEAKGQQTGTVMVSCSPYDPNAMLAACGFPGG